MFQQRARDKPKPMETAKTMSAKDKIIDIGHVSDFSYVGSRASRINFVCRIASFVFSLSFFHGHSPTFSCSALRIIVMTRTSSELSRLLSLDFPRKRPRCVFFVSSSYHDDQATAREIVRRNEWTRDGSRYRGCKRACEAISPPKITAGGSPVDLVILGRRTVT